MINALLFFLSGSLQCQIAQFKLFSLVQQKTSPIVLFFIIEMIGLVYGMYSHFRHYVSYTMAVSFVGGGVPGEDHRPVASH
jgi:hypothetical protein